MSISFEVDLSVDRPLRELDHRRFLEAHVAFEGASTQQGQILNHLIGRAAGCADVLSVGCGSGILDAPLAATLPKDVRYLGLDPNPLHNRDFEARLEHVGRTGVPVQSTFEAFSTQERFDRVLMIHAHYYMADVPACLSKAVDLLKRDGKLVVAAAPKGPLNRLAELFWPTPPDRPLWFSEDLVRLFEDRGVQAPVHRIEGRLDVTPCLERSPQGGLIRDFIVHTDTRGLSKHLKDQVDQALRLMGRQTHDGRWLVPHPVDIFELSASTPSLV